MSEPAFPLLQPGDAEPLARLLAAARPEYLRHFHPFPFTREEIERRLHANREDRWWGVQVAGGLAGFFMLRGWDDGFARPAFGVFIAEEFAGRGLARRALDAALDYCRARGTAAIMLTVHPDNTPARRAYEAAGFQPEGVHTTGHLIYQLSLR